LGGFEAAAFLPASQLELVMAAFFPYPTTGLTPATLAAM
jgi:hypothetical protein